MSRDHRHRSRSPGSRATPRSPSSSTTAARSSDAHFHVTQFRGLRAHHPGPPGPRDAGDHGPHLRDLPGQPPGRVGQGRRRHPGRRAAAHRRGPAAGHQPGPDRPVERALVLPPLVAGPAVRLRRRPGRSATSSAWPARTRQLARDGIAPAQVGPADHRVARRQADPPRRGSSPAASPTPLTAEVRDRILAGVPEAIAAVERAIAWYKTDMLRWEEEAATFGNFRSAFMGLVDRHGNVDHYGGWLRVIDADGNFLADRVDPQDLQRLHRRGRRAVVVPQVDLLEGDGLPGRHLPGRTARPRSTSPTGWARRAPTRSSRSSAGASAGSPAPRSTTTTRASSTRSTRSRRSRSSCAARTSSRKHVRSFAGINRNEGIGVSEAPRGTLMHHYKVDDDGIVQWANLVIATGHNNMAMNRSRPPGGPPPRQGRHDHRADAQPGRGGHPLLRPVPELLHARPRPDGARRSSCSAPDGTVLDELAR